MEQRVKKFASAAPPVRAHRLLIISCSAAKRHGPPAEMPAIERYDGVFFKVLRKALREGHCRVPVEVRIISAKYGLVNPETRIPSYNVRMDTRQAEKLRSSIRRKLQRTINKNKPREILVNLGKAYAEIIRDLPELENATWAAGPIGKRAGALKSWLVNDK